MITHSWINNSYPPASITQNTQIFWGQSEKQSLDRNYYSKEFCLPRSKRTMTVLGFHLDTDSNRSWLWSVELDSSIVNKMDQLHSSLRAVKVDVDFDVDADVDVEIESWAHVEEGCQWCSWQALHLNLPQPVVVASPSKYWQVRHHTRSYSGQDIQRQEFSYWKGTNHKWF